jgi:predicted protein tyrosine phosphatase
MPEIHVCSLLVMEDMVAKTSASHLISLINEHMMPPTPEGLVGGNHLKLSMNDIETHISGYVAPSKTHIEQLVEFVHRWDQTGPMIIHCWAGISRSTAAAFIALCALNPDICETQIARMMRKKSPTATPNNLLISWADQHLGRSGRMLSAIEMIGRGEVAAVGVPFSMPIVLEEKKP